VFVLRRQADDLHARINRRVDWMFATGLVEETERLLAAGLERNRHSHAGDWFTGKSWNICKVRVPFRRRWNW
jgi:tRNA A37 N6-isopentenylltransferase MiaA